MSGQSLGCGPFTNPTTSNVKDNQEKAKELLINFNSNSYVPINRLFKNKNSKQAKVKTSFYWRFRQPQFSIPDSFNKRGESLEELKG